MTYLYIRNGRQRLLAVGMLSRKRQKTSHTQCDSSRNGFGFDPKRDPRHHDNETGRYVSMEKVVSQTPPELENHF